jgi:hypothetical protein
VAFEAACFLFAAGGAPWRRARVGVFTVLILIASELMVQGYNSTKMLIMIIIILFLGALPRCKGTSTKDLS